MSQNNPGGGKNQTQTTAAQEQKPMSATMRFWLIFGGNQAKGLGRTLRAIDADDKGQDDAIGKAVSAIGSGLETMGQGERANADVYLKAAADGIYEYLGLTPPGAPGE